MSNNNIIATIDQFSFVRIGDQTFVPEAKYKALEERNERLTHSLELFEEVYRKIMGEFPGVTVKPKDEWALIAICVDDARKALRNE